MRYMRLLIFNFIILFVVGIFLPRLVIAQDIELTVIGNPESVPDELNINQLKSVLRGERQRWDDGTSIKIALMKTNTPIGTGTCKKIYDMSGNELNKYFLALVFQGKVKAPTFFNSISDLESYVARTPGAIGVIQEATDELVKVVVVDGKKQI